MIDVARMRAETRGCQEVLHFNNAGASLPPAPVADYLYDFLRDEELRGGYETAKARHGELEHFYTATARLLGARSNEVAFVENATRAWDMVFYALPLAPGDKVLTTVAEYGSNLIAYLHRARLTRAELVVIPNDANGQIDLNALEKAIDERTRLISISHIPTGGGLVNPAEEVGRVARAHGIPYLLDACQSVGQLPLNVEELGCDFLSASGRKYLRAPRGTGFLYVRGEWIEQLDPPFLDQHAAELIDGENYSVREDARRFENWERYYAGQAALGRAVDYALDLGLEAIRDRVFDLAANLRVRLGGIPEVEVTDEGVLKCGIVTWRHARVGAEEIKRRFLANRINVSESSGSGMRLSYLARSLDSLVRSSVHYFNTEEEIDRFIGAVRLL
ncbi:MAG: aminotransferase [Rhodospirillaceae bacterium]|nr:aminotransferase [Rhodospirillaceae bacterium]